MTYGEFEGTITEIIKIRATNYRLTGNDIAYLIKSNYNEILNEVVIDFVEQKVKLQPDVNVYDLDALYAAASLGSPEECVSIITEDGYRVEGFRNTENNVWVYDKFEDGSLDNFDGRELIFRRIFIPDITELTTRQQRLLMPVIIEGIIYYVQDALPNPTTSQSPFPETNQHYAKYEMEKKKLMNRLPQRK